MEFTLCVIVEGLTLMEVTFAELHPTNIKPRLATIIMFFILGTIMSFQMVFFGKHIVIRGEITSL